MKDSELKYFLRWQDHEDILMAAENDNVEAMYHAGYMYAKGLNAPRDNARAEYWLQQAVMKKNENAAYTLGLMYLTGEGVEVNVHRGVHLIANAAHLRHKEAQHLLRRIKKYYGTYSLDTIAENIDKIEPGLLEQATAELIAPVFKNYKL